MEKNKKGNFFGIDGTSGFLHAIWPSIVLYFLIMYKYLSGLPVTESSSYFFLHDAYIGLFVSSVLFYIGLYLSSKDKINSICGMLIFTGIFYFPLNQEYLDAYIATPDTVGSIRWYSYHYYEFLSFKNLIFLGVIIFVVKVAFTKSQKTKT